MATALCPWLYLLTAVCCVLVATETSIPEPGASTESLETDSEPPATPRPTRSPEEEELHKLYLYMRGISYRVFMVMVHWQAIVPPIGLILNLFVFLVFVQKKRRRQSVSVVLMGLAVSDSVMLCTVIDRSVDFFADFTPSKVSSALCQLSHYIPQVSRDCSTYFILLFTIERFISVRFPLKRATLCTKPRMLIAMATVVVSSAAMEGFAFWFQAVHIRPTWTGPKPYCMLRVLYDRTEYSMWVIGTYGIVRLVIHDVIGFVLPCTIIALLNALLIRSLRQWSSKRAQLSQQTEKEKEKAKADQKSLTIMLVTVSTFSIVTLLPFIVSRLVFVYHRPVRYLYVMNQLTMNVGYMALVLNYSCNFFFYVLGGRQFRNEFVTIITCGKGTITCGKRKITCGKRKITCGKGKITCGKGKITYGVKVR